MRFLARSLLLFFLISSLACTHKNKNKNESLIPSSVTPTAQKIPLGLSENLNIPPENLITPEKIELGKMLYFDKRLSADNTISCATCHDPQKGWSDSESVSTGVRNQKGTRNSPTIVNSTYMTLQFWDGRAKTLEEQALGPIANPVEMGNNHEIMVKTIASIPGYQVQFQKVFGGPVTKERIAQAIATFERTILSGNSRYDRFVAGDKSALKEDEIRGKDLFFGKARCVVCHLGPNFSDSQFHNLGVGMNKPTPDLGRYLVTQQERDKGAFKTPGLRDLSRTAPYMHDGSQKTLEEVIKFYNQGGEANPQLDPLITQLNLTEQEEKDLVAFMKGLEGNPYPMVNLPELPK